MDAKNRHKARRPSKPKVLGSNPSGSATKTRILSKGESPQIAWSETIDILTNATIWPDFMLYAVATTVVMSIAGVSVHFFFRHKKEQGRNLLSAIPRRIPAAHWVNVKRSFVTIFHFFWWVFNWSSRQVVLEGKPTFCSDIKAESPFTQNIDEKAHCVT